MTDRRRIWITGIGVITAIGTGRDAFRAGLRAGRSPIRRIDRFDPSPFRSQVAAQVDDFDPLAWMPPKTARQLDRFSQFGLVAGTLALDDARMRPGEDGAASPERIVRASMLLCLGGATLGALGLLGWASGVSAPTCSSARTSSRRSPRCNGSRR